MREGDGERERGGEREKERERKIVRGKEKGVRDLEDRADNLAIWS